MAAIYVAECEILLSYRLLGPMLRVSHERAATASRCCGGRGEEVDLADVGNAVVV